MKIEKLLPSCNLDTIRGGIFTFIPKDPIVEFNFNIIKRGKVVNLKNKSIKIGLFIET